MRAPFTQLYVHLVWSTWDREPLITADVQPRLYAAMAVRCRNLHCDPISIGGVEDHVHLLVHLHPTVSVADLVKDVKGASSHLVNHIIQPGGNFRWQGAYGAFTLRRDEVDQVKAYIEHQPEHHADRSLQLPFECTEVEA